MDILIALIALVAGVVLERIYVRFRFIGTLLKVLDDSGAGVQLYLALDCPPDSLKTGEVVKMRVKEVTPQK